MSQPVSPHGSIGNYTDAFDSSLSLIPVQSPRQNIVQGRSFIYDKGVDCDSDNRVLSTLKEQLSRIETIYKKKIDEVHQNLHQRSARRKLVVNLHNKWKQELEELWTKLMGDEAISEAQYRYIPLMESPKKQSRALLLMMRLEMLGHSLKHTTQELILILGAQQYSKALVFYKDNVKACQALIHKPSLEQKVDGLISLFKQITLEHTQVKLRLEGQRNLVVEQTNLLFKELYEFIGYACDNFIKESKEGHYDIKRRLVAFKEEVQKSLATMTEHKIQQQPAGKAVLSYLKNAQMRSLKQEDDFRNGMWLATTPYVGIYTEIQTEVDALRTSAKALAALLETLQSRIREALEPEIATTPLNAQQELLYYNNIVDGIENHIDLQRLQLTKKPLSEKVHAGLYYVAKQRATVNQVRMYIRQLTLATSGKLRPFVKAVGHVVQYLDPQKAQAATDMHNLTSISALRNLYKAIRSACALSNPDENSAKPSFTKSFCSKAYTVISDTLANKGTKTVALTYEESAIPNMLFAKTPLARLRAIDPHAVVLPKAIRTYLMKALIASLHLSKADIDPQLEVALHFICSQHDYKDAFEETVREDPDFAELTRAYLRKSDMTEQSYSLTLMLEILSELLATAADDEAISRQRYYKITQYLFELAEQKPMPASQQNARLDWIKTVTQEPLKALEIKPYPGLVHTLLRKSLFASQDFQRRQAQQELTAYVQPANLANSSQDPTLYPLLQRWILERFISDSDDISHNEKQMLHAFFVEYLSNQEIREYWQSQYSIGTMEIALAKFSDLTDPQMPSILHTIHRKRSKAHFSLYKQITQLLATCTKANASSIVQQAIELFDKTGLDPDGPWEDLTSNLSIARCLLNLMRNC